MYIGADYYPEHWPRERWEIDAKLMKEAGLNVTRLAEFSWTKLEPNEGQFDFGWLDDAIETLGSQGVKVILCTPTPTMPKWMYDGYPEVVAEEKNGDKIPFGNRQNNCFTSASYRFFSERITRKMAQRYADNPHVIGWQLDNELWGPYCFCPSCESAFRDYLKEKYGTIERLNEEYGTIFWSQCYREFAEAHLPRHTNSSPSLDLDYKRFHSDHIIRFAAAQAEIIREYCPHHFITHNMMGFSESVDYYKLGEKLDIVAFDYYYNFGKDNAWENRLGEYRYGAASLDFMRSVKHKNFWMMENSISSNGWETFGRELRPGEIRRMTYQNIAHGVDGQMWFRWRTCRFGTEQYWHGIIGHDGLPLRRYQVVSRLAQELHPLYEQIKDTTVNAQVGIVMDFDDRWALSFQPNSAEFNLVKTAMLYYNALSRRGINVEFLRSEDNLNAYSLVILPAKYILTPEYTHRLEQYVRDGGTLVTTYRTGVKNTSNVPYEMTLPGHLRKLTGVRVEEYEAVPSQYPYEIQLGDIACQGSVLCDWILPETAEAIAGYADPDLKDYAAATVNAFGDGRVYYVGIESDKLTEQLIDRIVEELGLEQFGLLPEGVEISVRSSEDVKYIFIINHSSKNYVANVHGYDILKNENCGGAYTVAANDVAVIRTGK